MNITRSTASLLSAIVLLIVTSTPLKAAPETGKRSTIIGIAIDSATNKAIAYATVSLHGDSSATALGAVVTDEGGKFSLPVKTIGKYKVSINYVGYAVTSRAAVIDSEGQQLDLGQVTLKHGVDADAVVVTAKAPLVTSDMDKITYNLDADPETPALTALEMMRKVPLLTVDGEENIQLKGQSNFKVLLNGKSSTMMSRNFKDVLKSMPASSIKSIEVITNPPSKYDAEGIGGIINIITVRKTNNGFNGSVRGSLGFRGPSPTGSLGAYIAAAIGKFNVSANYGGYINRSASSDNFSSAEYLNSPSLHYMETNGSGNSKNMSNNFSVEGSYEIDTFNLVTLSLWGYLGDNKGENFSTTNYFDTERNLTRSYRNVNTSGRSYGSVSGNVDYQRTFIKPDRTFTASYKFDMSPNSSWYDQSIDQTLDYTPEFLKSDNTANGSEHTIQADYVDPLTDKHEIEAGIKYILRPNSSRTDMFRKEGDEWIVDHSDPNNMDYYQHIASVYAGYKFRLNKKFSAKVGARGEYTINDGTFYIKQEYQMFNRYFNIIPYANFGFKPTEKQNINLSYTQRLSRPGIWYLNPYVNDQNPSNISYGNPNLESVMSHAFNASYGIYGKKGSVNVSASANLTNNSIENVTTTLDNGVMSTTYENIGKRETYGGYFYGNINFFESKLTFRVNAGVDYTVLNANNGSGLSNQGWSWNGYISAYGQPWKNGNVSLYGGYYSSRVMLQGRYSDSYFTGLSVSHAFLDRKLRLGLNVQEPLTSKRYYSSTNSGPDFRSYSEGSYWSRSASISLSWNFGKMQTQVKKARRGINNEDKMSGGGGSSSGGGQ